MRWGRSSQRAEAEAYVEAAIPRLTGLAYALTGTKADAEDLVQDTLATVLVKWNRVSEAENLDAYVRRTMVNTLMSKNRRRASTEVISHEQVTADWSAPSVPSGEGAVVDRTVVLDLVRRLPDRQRAVVALRYYEDLPDRDIAQARGCSEQAVRSAAHAALKSLRAILTGPHAEEAHP